MGLDLAGRPLPDQFWEFVLVFAHPFEELYVERRGVALHNIHGVQPKGFSARLTMGDKVYWKPDGHRWALKFRLSERCGKECIRYGETYGPHPDQWRVLAHLPRQAFAHAGIDPEAKRIRSPRMKRGRRRTHGH